VKPTTTHMEELRPLAGHSPERERPLGGYAVLMALFGAAAGAFSAWFRRSGRELPDRMSAGDLALVTVATHKASRLIAKDRVTSAVRALFTRYQHDDGPGEVSEAARGHGLRRAVGELLVCPYCIGMWISAAFAAGLLVAPRFTRWFAAVLVAVFGADVLQIAYKKAEDAL
jgi:Protein of unknown function (DUF1360)